MSSYSLSLPLFAEFGKSLVQWQVFWQHTRPCAAKRLPAQLYFVLHFRKQNNRTFHGKSRKWDFWAERFRSSFEQFFYQLFRIVKTNNTGFFTHLKMSETPEKI